MFYAEARLSLGLGYKDNPRPPVCPEAEWRMLLFLHNAQQTSTNVPIEQIDFIKLESGERFHLPAIRKPQIYGVRSYLTLPENSYHIPMYLASAGHILEGPQPIAINPTARYLLRPVISSPNISIFSRLQSCFQVNEEVFQNIRENVLSKGYMSVLTEYVSMIGK